MTLTARHRRHAAALTRGVVKCQCGGRVPVPRAPRAPADDVRRAARPRLRRHGHHALQVRAGRRQPRRTPPARTHASAPTRPAHPLTTVQGRTLCSHNCELLATSLRTFFFYPVLG